MASLLQVSDFLAAFAAGVTVTTLDEETRSEFVPLGELIIPLLKVGTIFLFGVVVRSALAADVARTLFPA